MKTKMKIFIAALFAGLMLLLPAVVAAQGEPTPETGQLFDFVVFGEVIIGWMVYWLFGMCDALANKTAFDGKKVAYSFIVSLVVGIAALVTGLSPNIVWESNKDIISSTITTLLNTSAFLPLIYIFNKLFGILSALWNRAWKGAFPPAAG